MSRALRTLAFIVATAILYGADGDVVQVWVEPGEDVVQVEVEDHRRGIPLEEQPRLFDAYFRSAMACPSAPGVGLGLAIVKAIVDAHGGNGCR